MTIRMSNKKPLMKNRLRRKGTSIVEFALILPMLLMLTMGLIQYGIVLNARLSLYHVSRAASRYAAVNGTIPDIDTNIKSKTVSIASGYGLKLLASDISLSPSQNTTTPSVLNSRVRGGQLNMTITYDMSKKVFLPKTVFGAPMPWTTSVSTTSVMVLE